MTLDVARKYAPVLMRMIDIMAEREGTFGEALVVAARDCGHDSLPPDVETALLTTAFQIIGSQRIPGAADA